MVIHKTFKVHQTFKVVQETDAAVNNHKQHAALKNKILAIAGA
jgi:hypothetical protein